MSETTKTTETTTASSADETAGKDARLQDDLRDSAHKIWLAGLGALAVAEEEGSKLLKSAEESGRSFFKNLVDRGEAWERKNRETVESVKGRVGEATERARDQAESTWSKVEGRVDEAVASALGRAGVPTREEIATLTRRVEELTRTIEQLKSRA